MKLLSDFLQESLINEILDPNAMKVYDWTEVEKSKQQTFPGTTNEYQVSFFTDSGKEYVISFNRIPKAKDIYTRAFFMAEIKNGRKNFKTMVIPRGEAIKILGTALKIYQTYKEDVGLKIASFMLVISKGMIKHGKFINKVLNRAFRSKPRLSLKIVGAEEESSFWNFPALHLSVPALNKEYPEALFAGDAQGALYQEITGNVPGEELESDVDASIVAAGVETAQKEEPTVDSVSKSIVGQKVPSFVKPATDVKKKEKLSKDAVKSIKTVSILPKEEPVTVSTPPIIPIEEPAQDLSKPTSSDIINLSTVNYTEEEDRQLKEKYPPLTEDEYKLAFVYASIGTIEKGGLEDKLDSDYLQSLMNRAYVNGNYLSQVAAKRGTVYLKIKINFGDLTNFKYIYEEEFAKIANALKLDTDSAVKSKSTEATTNLNNTTINELFNILIEFDKTYKERVYGNHIYPVLKLNNPTEVILFIKKTLKESGKTITASDLLINDGGWGSYSISKLYDSIPALRSLDFYNLYTNLDKLQLSEIKEILKDIPAPIVGAMFPILGMFTDDTETVKRSFIGNWTVSGGSEAQKIALAWLNEFPPYNVGGLWKPKDDVEVIDSGVSHFRSIYEQTQQFFANKYKRKYNNGKGMLKLYRGIGLKESDAISYRPGAIESWTTQLSTAKNFAKMMARGLDNNTGAILEVEVPYDAIFASYESLKGVFPPEEYLKGKKEHILLGGALKQYPCKVMYTGKVLQFSEWLLFKENEMNGRTLRIVTSNDDDYEEVIAKGGVVSGAEEDAKITNKFEDGYGPNEEDEIEFESE